MYRRRRRFSRKRKRFRRGYDRTGGFYGRYSGHKRRRQLLEKKFLDFDIGTVSTPIPVVVAGTILNTGTFLIITQGNGESQRIGRKCIIKNINWRIDIQTAIGIRGEQDGATMDTNQELYGSRLRIILYLDKQANGAATGVAEILEGGLYNDWRNLENINRFIILKDIQRPFNNRNIMGGAYDGTTNQYVISNTIDRINIQWKGNLPIEYNATSGIMATIRSYNIGALIIGDQSSAMEMVSTVRVRFIG